MDVMDYEGLLTIVLTLLLKCGYILVHVGCVPTTNVHNIYTQYLFNMGTTTLVYILCGSTFTLGQDWHGFIGTKWTENCEYRDIVRVWSYFMQSTSVVQLVTAGRIHTIGDLLVSCLYASIIYPIVVHSVWSPNSWMTTTTVVSGFAYEDVAGGSVIHLFGGGFAIGAMLVFGGRIINVHRLDHNSLGINAQATSTLGYLIVILSTSGLMMLSPYIPTDKIAVSQLNIIIALGTGLAVTTLFYFLIMKSSYWTIIWTLQGGLASVIALSCGIGTYTACLSFFYAFLGVSFYLLFSVAIRTSGLEDYCNVISIHFIQGLLGSYLVTFNSDNLKLGSTDLLNKTLWQGICSTMIFFFGGLSSATIFVFLLAIRLLRNKDEQEIFDEMDTLEYGCCMKMKRHLDASSGDLIRPGYHTFIKFRNKRSAEDQVESENPSSEQHGDNKSLAPLHL